MSVWLPSNSSHVFEVGLLYASHPPTLLRWSSLLIYLFELGIMLSSTRNYQWFRLTSFMILLASHLQTESEFHGPMYP